MLGESRDNPVKILSLRFLVYFMESQTRSSKRAPRELQSWRVQGNPPTLTRCTLCEPLASPVPTLRQPVANPLPTFSANPFCQPLSKLLFPWAPITGLETRVNGFLFIVFFLLRLQRHSSHRRRLGAFIPTDGPGKWIVVLMSS